MRSVAIGLVLLSVAGLAFAGSVASPEIDASSGAAAIGLVMNAG